MNEHTGTGVFEQHRQRLTSLAYQMLGEIQAAEDVVQESWIRWQGADQNSIENPGAWLYRVTTRLALDQLRSARLRREQYAGPWLPEPVLDSGPADAFELARECELALLWSLERLSEEERAAFLLSQVFETPYSEISRSLGRSEQNCRQLVSRARKRLAQTAPRFEGGGQNIESAMQAFMAAAAAGDREQVLRLLAPDVVAIADGGGVVSAARIPLVGRERVAQVYMHLVRKNSETQGFEWITLNSRPAIARLRGNSEDVITTLRLDRHDRIAWIYTLRNPQKLGVVRARVGSLTQDGETWA